MRYNAKHVAACSLGAMTMAIRTDTALQYMPQRLQDEFRDEVSRAGRRGPIADAVLPLNSALLDRQARIDALTAERDRLRAELESLRRDAARYRWLATEHAVMLLKRFPSPGPYHEATEVIDAAIDAAMTGETR